MNKDYTQRKFWKKVWHLQNNIDRYILDAFFKRMNRELKNLITNIKYNLTINDNFRIFNNLSAYFKNELIEYLITFYFYFIIP